MADVMRVAGVETHGLRELVKALRATGEKEILAGLVAANVAAAELVAERARSNASTSMERNTAAVLRPSRTAAYAQLRLGGTVYALGAEFGAHRNLRRLIKATAVRVRSTKTGDRIETIRARSTIVRDGESASRVSRRVESQYVDHRGRNVGRRGGGQQVRLERTAGGAVKTIRGWNQFKPWRGNSDSAGYFLWPAIRQSREQLLETYADAIDQLIAQRTADVSPSAA